MNILCVTASHPIPVYAKTCIGGISVYIENSEMGKRVTVRLFMSQAIPIYVATNP